MEHLRRLNELWSWLPAFRAVAETEHLPTASKLLRVSPSALSRSIKLLEEQIGKPLFQRDNGHLYLNEEGHRLLDSLRIAMQGLDDGLSDVREEEMVGCVRVSAPSTFSLAFVVPALNRLKEQHPRLIPELCFFSEEQMNEGLAKGTLDLAILDQPRARKNFTVERLMPMLSGVYCGPLHPLYGATKVTLEEILEHPFVVPPEGSDDHFPKHLDRKIGMRVNQLQLGVVACATSKLLAAIPAIAAETYSEIHAGGQELWRLPIEICKEGWLYAVRRKSEGLHNRAEIVLDAIRVEVEGRGQVVRLQVKARRR